MIRKSICILASMSILAGGCAAEPEGDAVEEYDIAILNGRVIDPETRLDAVRNIGVIDDRIAIITQDDVSADKIIDAEGKVVAPGFIDLHAHGQDIPAGRMMALDGVTTMLELEAGVLPVSTFYENAELEGRPINYGASAGWSHARIATKLNVDGIDSPEAFDGLFGRKEWREGKVSDEELAEILQLIKTGLDEGGLGVGVLLGYAPLSEGREFLAVSALAAEYDAPVFAHARNASAVEPQGSFQAVQELIAVAAITGVHMHVCHLNSISLRKIDDIAPMIKAAQSNGVRISVEAYPYGAGSTVIGASLFQGPLWREKLGGVEKSDFTAGGVQLTDEEFDRLQAEAPETVVVVHLLKPEERPQDQAYLDQSVLFPGGAIAGDGGYWETADGIVDADVWPLPEDAESHPRSAGTYSRFLRSYVREREAISLLDAIEKLTLIPARIVEPVAPQMKRKGRIQEGADADLVIFDLETVSDRATYDFPAQASQGVEHVIVSGTPIVVNGEIDTNVLPGRPVRGRAR